MKHRDLVRQARKWLKVAGKCNVILTESGSSIACEIPDAIGWRSARHSILIECKTSRADFRADAKKWFRQDGYGMGQQRFFLAPEGVIPIDELPPDWGLLEIVEDTIRTTKKCDLVYMDEQRCWAEMPLLVASIRRLQIANANLKKRLRSPIR